MRPRIIVVAGCNGAGKSTLTNRRRDPSLPVIDPDKIAVSRGLAPIAAGRAALRLLDEYCRQHKTFLIETTLSGKALMKKLSKAQQDCTGLCPWQDRFPGI